jgi:PKD repeat protein
VTKDAAGPVVRHKFTTPGVYKVTPTVTDPRGARDTKDLLVMVTQTVQCAQAPAQKTGGWRHRHNDDAQKHHYCINDKDAKTKGDRLSMTFEGPRLHLHHGRASNGGSAVMIIDGKLQKGAINFFGKNKQPGFGFKREYRGLGKGGTPSSW